MILFQKADHFLGGLLILRHDILDISAQRRLDCNLVLLLHLNNVRYNSEKLRITAFLLHNLADAVAVSVITLRNVSKRFQSGLLLM